ncbi:MAG: hypothetical protein MN733_23330, partial [Nitrososphaera sp.]|nr:hypothetical protein [Nitrososphaera sp.]
MLRHKKFIKILQCNGVMDLLRISWDATIEYCEQLALKTRDFRPEIIVGLSRGGLVLTRIMSDILAVEKVG